MPHNFGYMFNRILYDDYVLDELEKHSKKYENISDRDLIYEIERVQKEVPNEVKLHHMKNLEALTQMNTFSQQSSSDNLPYLKDLIKVDENVPSSSRLSRSQYVSGSSLLLWFLLVVALYRRPFGRRGFGRRKYY
jgi:hypothetical protein